MNGVCSSSLRPSVIRTVRLTGHVGPRLDSAGRPAHLDAIHATRLAGAEIQRKSALRVVTAAADHFSDLLTAVHLDGTPGADRAAIGARPGQRDGDGVLPGTHVLEQSRAIVHIDDQDLRTSVTIEVAGRQAARRAGRREARTGGCGHVGKASIPEIAIEQGLLAIGFADRRAVDFGIHVPVGENQVGPSILVDIEEGDTPTEQLIASQTRGFRDVFEELAVLVLVKRWAVAGEVGLGDVQ